MDSRIATSWISSKRWLEPTTLTWIERKSEPREIQKAAQSNLRRVDWNQFAHRQGRLTVYFGLA